MTLIAGFKCTDGYVLCADSQETVTRNGFDYRVTRQKLAPIAVGKVPMAVAGSGDGDLIDAFVGRFSQKYQHSEIAELDCAISRWPDVCSAGAIHRRDAFTSRLWGAFESRAARSEYQNAYRTNRPSFSLSFRLLSTDPVRCSWPLCDGDLYIFSFMP